MIDLEKFCDKEGMNERIRNPWRVNGFVYSTDGTILIRVNSDVEMSGEIIDGTEKQPNVETIIAGWDSIKSWRPLPDFSQCPHCNDNGIISHECTECHGNGDHGCICGNTHDCGQCDGEGEISVSCKKCGIILGPRKIANRLARLIQSLPNAQYGIDSDEKNKPIHFKFDGGVGLAMPLYQE